MQTHLRHFLSAALLLALTLPAPARKTAAPIKAGTYNLMTSDARRKVIQRDSSISPQRFWCNSAQAVAQMITELDCDVIGLQEVCDSIWGVKGDRGIQGLTPPGKYEWILYPNSSKGRIAYDTAIGYKPARLKCLKSGIFWTGGYPDQPKSERKGAARPCTWALFKDLQSGKKFYFLSVHIHYKQHKVFNLQNFFPYADKQLIPRKTASILVGDMNSSSRMKEYAQCLAASRWTNAYDKLHANGALPAEEIIGSMNAKNESSIGKVRLDHILYEGFIPLSVHTDTRQFPTADGTLHYPSDHLPVVCVLKFR